MAIIHIVSFKFKEAVSPSAREEVFRRFKALQSECVSQHDGQPYIQSVKAGAKNINPEGKGHGFHVGANGDFDQKQSLCLGC